MVRSRDPDKNESLIGHIINATTLKIVKFQNFFEVKYFFSLMGNLSLWVFFLPFSVAWEISEELVVVEREISDSVFGSKR